MRHRIRWTALILLLSLATAPAYGSASGLGHSLAELGDFGADGARVPEVAREFLDEGFFTRDLTASFDNGQNYTASLAVPQEALRRTEDLGRGLIHRREAVVGLRLFLTNLADRPNDIAVSAVRDGGTIARNALVRVEPGETLGLAADELAAYDEVRLLSIQSFEATAMLDLPGQRARCLGYGRSVLASRSRSTTASRRAM